MSTHESSPVSNLAQRLWNGEAGLATSYWGYGVAAGFIWGLALGALKPAPGSSTAQLLLACMAAYFFCTYVGIWRAADKYQGKKAWSALAKVSVVLGALVTVLPVVVGLLKSTAP